MFLQSPLLKLYADGISAPIPRKIALYSFFNSFKVISFPNSTLVLISIFRFFILLVKFSVIFLGSLNPGIPYVKSPPICSSFSKIVTSYPFFASSTPTLYTCWS